METEVGQSVQNFFMDFFMGGGVALIKALAILMVGLIVIRGVSTFVRSATIKSRNLDNSASSFITSLIKVVAYLLLAILVLGIAGVNTASLIAAFAAVALAVSLGLQDTLAGLTNGILIIFTKPFKQGDYVNIGGTEGTVKEIRLFNTRLTTPDNLDIIVPNSSVLNSNVTNYSRMPLRRIDIALPVSYESDIEQVKSVVLALLKKDKRIVKTPAPMCRLKDYADSAIVFTVRAWVDNSVFWDVKFDLMERLFNALKENEIQIPFNQMDVHILPEQKESV